MKCTITTDNFSKKHIKQPIWTSFIWNWFKLLGLKRKPALPAGGLALLCLVERFFELHSKATEGKKDKNRAQKGNFLAN